MNFALLRPGRYVAAHLAAVLVALAVGLFTDHLLTAFAAVAIVGLLAHVGTQTLHRLRSDTLERRYRQLVEDMPLSFYITSIDSNLDPVYVSPAIVDYIFRWFGKRFLTAEQQEEVGILTPEVKAMLAARYTEGADGTPAEPLEQPPPGQTALFNSWEDAVECARCGGRMVRTGSCYTCRDCGTNTGCS